MIIIRIRISRLSRYSSILIAAGGDYYPGIIDLNLNPGKNEFTSPANGLPR